MLVIIKFWIISLALWPIALKLFLLLQSTFSSLSFRAIKNFLINLGWTFVGAGGFGAIAGITSNISVLEVSVRALVALIFISFGFILVLSNMERK